MRKVRPLRKQLRGLKAWITGQRKDQSPGTRDEVPVVQVDPVFEGAQGEGRSGGAMPAWGGRLARGLTGGRNPPQAAPAPWSNSTRFRT